VAVDKAVGRAMNSDGRRPGEETEEERAEIAEQLELSPKQFAAVMESGGVPLTTTETRVLVTMFDRDANGKISREEFLAFTGYGERPKTRGDVNEILRTGNLCTWEASDHVTGMANAFQVQPDTDNILAAASATGPGGRRRSIQQKKKKQKKTNGNGDGYDNDGFESETADEYDDDDDDDNYSEDDNDEFKVDVGMVSRASIIAACRPVFTRNGSEKAGWVRYPLPDLIKRQRTLLAQRLRLPQDLDKAPPSSCGQTSWTNEQRAEAVKQLKHLARTNKELQDTVTRVTSGNPPAPPLLFTGGSRVSLTSNHDEYDEDNYDDDDDQQHRGGVHSDLDRETTLVIRWAPGGTQASPEYEGEQTIQNMFHSP
jgi:hypothetical protein